jgi:hypothetical protein
MPISVLESLRLLTEFIKQYFKFHATHGHLAILLIGQIVTSGSNDLRVEDWYMQRYACPVCDEPLACSKCQARSAGPEALAELFGWLDRHQILEQRPKGLPGTFEIPCRTCGKALTCSRCQRAAWAPTLSEQARQELSTIQVRLWKET